MSAPTAFLTIDDGPSVSTRTLSDFLVESSISALMFMRGDFLEQRMDDAVYAVKRGMTIGNHLYSHTRASRLGFQETRIEILKTEELIELAYKQAETARPGKYFRFPYIDRGDGDEIERRFPAMIRAAATGVPPAIAQNENVECLQNFLRSEGFEQPFGMLTHPIYNIPEISQAADCLFTYSTCDWMLAERHLNKCVEGAFPHKTVEDLKQAMDRDPFLRDEKSGPAIVLIHDSPEIHTISVKLVEHMLAHGFVFHSFPRLQQA
ncbi:MAG: polysaccharide deacetylase family protein [Alphaproteobacteria bacterium]|nr:polysaccharide deacetylase family protein [Alphaproteobacteria bacterium]